MTQAAASSGACWCWSKGNRWWGQGSEAVRGEREMGAQGCRDQAADAALAPNGGWSQSHCLLP